MLYIKKGISKKTNKTYYAIVLEKLDKVYYLSFDKITICNLLGCSPQDLPKYFTDCDTIKIN